MSQSYSLGTILSVGFGPTLEQVIVLNGDKVATKTFAGKPVERRDIMSMADWLIVIGDQKIQIDYLPLPVSPAEPQAEAEPQAQAPVQPQPKKVYPIGTKLSWKPTGETDRWGSPNSRTAIVLKDGVLQVKEVINHVTTMNKPGATYSGCARKFFSSLADWEAQLPAGGSITASEVTEDFSVPSIQRKAKAPVKATTDVDYMNELRKRFSVHAYLDEGFTPTQSLASEVNIMRANMDVINDLTTPLSLSTTRAPQDIAIALVKAYFASQRLCRASKRATRIQGSICFEPSKALVAPIYFRNDYKQRLVAFAGGQEIEITSNSKMGLIGLAGNPDKACFGKWFSPKVGKTFAELGIDMKADGKPRLKVYYRRESIEL